MVVGRWKVREGEKLENKKRQYKRRWREIWIVILK